MEFVQMSADAARIFGLIDLRQQTITAVPLPEEHFSFFIRVGTVGRRIYIGFAQLMVFVGEII